VCVCGLCLVQKEGRYTVYERLRLLNALLSEAQHDRCEPPVL